MNFEGIKKHKSFVFITTLGFALGVRQMAMTMVMPFLSVYSRNLENTTPLLASISLGIFGLMQAIFQIPYGIWSDKKGNKIVMIVGLLQVIFGLLLAYYAKDIYTLILARAIQGSGAVIGVGYSWIASKSESQKERINNLSIISIIVGSAAACSFALGPMIHRFVSVKNMFLYSALLIFIAWIVIIFFLKDSRNQIDDNAVSTKDIIKILMKDKSFIALNLGAFINNFIMTAVFFVIPQYLEKLIGIDGMWKVFMPTVLIAIIIMRIVVKKLNNVKSINFLISSFLICAIGICFYINKNSLVSIFIGTLFFMIAYISVGTIVPSLGNYILEESYRGVGNGIINSLQYVGSFIGSIVIGVMWSINEIGSFIILTLILILASILIKIFVNKEKFDEEKNIRNCI
ncbi:MFS transporter [uncultured Clostridium sp.]|uniref:MFS transporter n=1 Tax=uncultured Clostridium sp. TaxID=59620 RepID=UPI0028E85846|nr:MFS transporter [uncultured Clostridium sp.]